MTISCCLVNPEIPCTSGNRVSSFGCCIFFKKNSANRIFSAILQKKSMSSVKIPYLNEILHPHHGPIVESLKNLGCIVPVDRINWKEYPVHPVTTLYLGYCLQRIWLHFEVQNDYLRAECSRDQEPVWQDSCVEFFIKQGDVYRNFEFNCLGICLSAYGPDRHSRISLEEQALSQIIRFPSLDAENVPTGELPVSWTLTIGIPLNLIGLKAGDRFFANFYKCGDETRFPHYLSWSPIATLTPDFHRPEYFGLLELE